MNIHADTFDLEVAWRFCEITLRQFFGDCS